MSICLALRRPYGELFKTGTKWQIALLPLGGFVKFLKDEDVSGDLCKSFGTFDGASVLSRILTVLAGPMANFILSFVILVIFVLVNGISSDKIQIKRILPNMSGKNFFRNS